MKNKQLIWYKNQKMLALAAVLLIVITAAGVYFFYGRRSSVNQALESYNSQLPELKKKAETNPEDYRANQEYAYALYVTRNNDDAIEAYEKVLELNQEDARSRNNLGNIYRSEKKLEEAAAAYQESINADPDQVNAYVNLANLYIYDMDKPEEGYAVFDQAIEKHPENLDIKMMYAKILDRFNQKEKADEIYQSILEINPEHERAAEALAS